MATTSITSSKQLTIRVGNNTLSFTITDSANAEQPVQHEPYVVKSGISMAANLREAFRTYAGAIDLPSARVLINTPVLMVPIEQFQEADATTLYLHSFPESEKDLVRYNVLPSLNAVCIFCINKDLLMVLTDHFNDVQLLDKQLDICSFQQNRFKFCNSFDTTRAYDAIFFLLYVWKQLNLQPEHDEIHILGEIPDQDWLLQELHKYVKNTFVMPYDPLSYANYHGKI